MLDVLLEPGRMQVRKTMFDAEDGEEASCSKNTFVELEASMYTLVPGPIALGVQVSGTLLASGLIRR